MVSTRSSPNYGESNRRLSSRCTGQRICTVSPSLGIGRFSKLPLLPPTPELLVTATTFEAPPTEITPPKNMEDYMRPRALMGMKIFHDSCITKFLIHGLQKDENDELKLTVSICTNITANFYLIYSLAQGSQRPHCLLPRNPIKL